MSPPDSALSRRAQTPGDDGKRQFRALAVSKVFAVNKRSAKPWAFPAQKLIACKKMFDRQRGLS
jgi:hypothetical protein